MFVYRMDWSSFLTWIIFCCVDFSSQNYPTRLKVESVHLKSSHVEEGWSRKLKSHFPHRTFQWRSMCPDSTSFQREWILLPSHLRSFFAHVLRQGSSNLKSTSHKKATVAHPCSATWFPQRLDLLLTFCKALKIWFHCCWARGSKIIYTGKKGPKS